MEWMLFFMMVVGWLYMIQEGQNLVPVGKNSPFAQKELRMKAS